MVVAMARDIRVLLVKLCDRVDNMRTLEHMKPEAQERIARETMEIYAPLANRLGIQAFKSELEDLVVPVPRARRVRRARRRPSPRRKRERDKYIADVSQDARERASPSRASPPRSPAARSTSTRSGARCRRSECDFEQIHDVIAFRVLVESVSDCYAALGVIHSQVDAGAGPLQGLHRAAEAEHVPVAPHDGHRPGARAHRDPDPHARDAPRRRARHRRALEVQGAHGGGIADSDAQRFGWLRQLMEWQKELKDPAEFLESVKVDLFQDEVYVFTPKGDVRVFPRGATPIDFAFAIHSQLGEHSPARA